MLPALSLVTMTYIAHVRRGDCNCGHLWTVWIEWTNRAESQASERCESRAARSIQVRILILNGSPAGEDSITLQTIEYLKILFPDHEYETLHVGRRIRAIERDFSESHRALEAAELIVFCYPVYTFLVPAQLHRFIELIDENGVDLRGKLATQLSTSKHFYDVTAHRFIEDACADLGLSYIRGLSADMEDLLNEKGQAEARSFFEFVLWSIERGYSDGAPQVRQEHAPVRIASSVDPVPHEDGRRVALVTDLDPISPNQGLSAMIDRFRSRIPWDVDIVNLREFDFAGGCLGCFKCASSGKCFYPDGFDDFLRTRINSADAVVYAYTVDRHSMGYRFKLYDDRQFCNGHRTVTMGKPVGYLVDGDLAHEENLRMLMESRAQVGGNYLAGIACDANDPDAGVDRLADTLEFAVRNCYNQPRNFYGVGGLKIFRDLIYQMQGLMKADHRFYKQNGFYDFPQKRRGTIIGMYFVSALMGSKTLAKKSKITMTEGMLMSYRKVLEQARAKGAEKR